jgi:hypothetical protein
MVRIHSGLPYLFPSDVTHSPINNEFAANGECGLVRGEEHGRLGYLRWFSQPLRWNLALERFEFRVSHPKLLVEGSRDRTATKRVDSDATRDQLARQRTRKG